MRFFLLRCAPFRGIHLYVLSQVTSYLYLHSYLYYYLYRCALICIYLSSSLSLSLCLSLSCARSHTHTHTHKLARTYKHTNIHTRSLSSYTHTQVCGGNVFANIWRKLIHTLSAVHTLVHVPPRQHKCLGLLLFARLLHLSVYVHRHARCVHSHYVYVHFARMCMYTVLAR
jgi:hypothetical protein